MDIVQQVWKKCLGVNSPEAKLAKEAASKIEELRAQLDERDARIKALEDGLLRLAPAIKAGEEENKQQAERITALEAGLREAREALDVSTRHFGIKRLGNSTLADSNARSANHNAIANIDKLLERLCQRGADVERLR